MTPVAYIYGNGKPALRPAAYAAAALAVMFALAGLYQAAGGIFPPGGHGATGGSVVPGGRVDLRTGVIDMAFKLCLAALALSLVRPWGRGLMQPVLRSIALTSGLLLALYGLLLGAVGALSSMLSSASDDFAWPFWTRYAATAGWGLALAIGAFAAPYTPTPTRGQQTDAVEAGRMSLADHLRELRSRMAKSLLIITVGVVFGYVEWQPILDFVQQPYCSATGVGHCSLVAFGPLEQFAIRIKTGSIAGVVVTSPLWLYQLGAFITPALHRHEKRYALLFVATGSVLFATGCAVAYATLGKGLEFLLHVGGTGVVTLLSLQSYLNFVALTLIAFGVAFLFPLVLMFLNIVGLLSAQNMRSWRRGMAVGIAVLAAIITPSTDPYTFTFLAVPLYGLYECCIVLARLRERHARRIAEIHALELPDDTPSDLWRL